jgi:hypothetical protein
MEGDLLVHITGTANDCVITRTQTPKISTVKTYEAAIARRRLTSCKAAATASFDALCSRHKSLARLAKIFRLKQQSKPCTTYLARNMNTTDNVTLFNECGFRLCLGRGTGYPIRAIDLNIRCSLQRTTKSATGLKQHST